jgi:hypothetical protein
VDFLIGQHVFKGKERKKKENVVGAKLPSKPPHAPPHLDNDAMIFLKLPQIRNFHHLNPLHMSYEVRKVT